MSNRSTFSQGTSSSGVMVLDPLLGRVTPRSNGGSGGALHTQLPGRWDPLATLTLSKAGGAAAWPAAVAVTAALLARSPAWDTGETPSTDPTAADTPLPSCLKMRRCVILGACGARRAWLLLLPRPTRPRLLWRLPCQRGRA